jgi:translation initiation factor 2 beta subunit (eIF-2beta)/eIF-5
VNIDAVAAALGREPARLVKHLGKSLGTNAQYKSGVATLRGHLLPAAVQESVQESVQDFVDSDVLCGECQNPETVLEVKKGAERRQCKACGHKTVN